MGRQEKDGLEGCTLRTGRQGWETKAIVHVRRDEALTKAVEEEGNKSLGLGD